MGLYLAKARIDSLEAGHPGTMFAIGEDLYLLEGVNENLQTFLMGPDYHVNMTRGMELTEDPLISISENNVIDYRISQDIQKRIKTKTNSPIEEHIGLLLTTVRALDYSIWLYKHEEQEKTINALRKEWDTLSNKMGEEYRKGFKQVRQREDYEDIRTQIKRMKEYIIGPAKEPLLHQYLGHSNPIL